MGRKHHKNRRNDKLRFNDFVAKEMQNKRYHVKYKPSKIYYSRKKYDKNCPLCGSILTYGECLNCLEKENLLKEIFRDDIFEIKFGTKCC